MSPKYAGCPWLTSTTRRGNQCSSDDTTFVALQALIRNSMSAGYLSVDRANSDRADIPRGRISGFPYRLNSKCLWKPAEACKHVLQDQVFIETFRDG